MKKILVPVDFSSHTDYSCRYALSVARVIGAEITLFHSFFDRIYFSDSGFATGFESGVMVTDEIILDFYRQKTEHLEKIAGEMKASLTEAEKKAIPIQCRMESGDPEMMIMQAIQSTSPDLVIMGSGGLGKKGFLGGSVAKRIIGHTNSPVIAVPGANFPPAIRNVAYMTNFDPADEEVITMIIKLLEPFQIKISCLHVLQQEEEEPARQKMAMLSEKISSGKLKESILCHIIGHDNYQEALKNFMDREKIDLIAFIPHRRNLLMNLFYHGITKKDLFLTQIPVLAIRPL